MRIYLLIALLFLIGCGKGLNIEPPRVSTSMKEVGLDFVKNISSSNVIGINLPSISVVIVSSIPINASASAKILEKYNKPLIQVDKIEAYLSKKYPDNAKYVKVYRKYEDKVLISEEVEYTEPIKVEKQSLSVMYILLITILGFIIYGIFKKNGRK